MTEKTCSSCKRILAVSNFYKQRKHKDGLMYECKACHYEAKKRRYLNGKAEREKMEFEGDRVCSKCDRTLSVSHFYKSIENKEGLKTHCKTCQKAYVIAWQKKNKDSFGSYQRKWKHQNKEKCDAAAKYSKVRIKYGLSKEEYDKLMEQTHCTICNADLTERKSGLDHCHRTGRIRGVLCKQCNTGLGMFHDNPETLKKAAEYLG